MTIEEKLKKIGLRDAEARIYLYLLENGVSMPSQIARGTGIARTNAYHLLYDLKSKDLITEQAKGKRKAYLPRDPQALLLELERKKEVVEDILPDLRGVFTRQKNKPKIQFFENWEEVRQIYLQSLSAEKIYALGSIKKLAALDDAFFAKYQKEIRERKIVHRDIITAQTDERMAQVKDTVGVLYAGKFLPTRHAENPTDMLIWDNNVALITLEEPVFGTVLTNPFLAQTFKTIFEALWEKL